MTPEELKTVLHKTNLFSDLIDRELDIIIGAMEIKPYPLNSNVFQEGVIGREFYIILSGSVQVFKADGKQKEHQIAKLKAGQTFGEMALLDQMPRSASVSTLENSSLAILTQESFQRLQKEASEVYTHVLLNMAKEFSARLRSMDDKFVKMMGFFF